MQRILSILASALVARGIAVDLVTHADQGELRAIIDPRVRIVPLARSSWLGSRLAVLRADPRSLPALARVLLSRKHGSSTLRCLPALANYLREVRPMTLFAATPFINLEAVLARELAGVDVRIVISERTHFSTGKPKKVWRNRNLAPAMRRLYLRADAIVAVSHGVANDLAAAVGIPRERVTVLYNPTLTPDFEARAGEPVDHPWLAVGQPPVILGVGRVTRQKDFPTLIRAFAHLRRKLPCRLMIIGRYRRKEQVMTLAEELGVQQDVQLLGFLANPLPYMRKAKVLALSSRFEGFPNVLLEALACGTPVVSTDCPSGPREILADGAFGELVPVGDDLALADAIERTLANPPDPRRLIERARQFGYDSAVDRYMHVILPKAAEVESRPRDLAVEARD